MITRPAPVAPAKQLASNHIRRLAKQVRQTFPDMDVHQHLTDAARENDAGRTDNAKRHLDAAVASFAPLQLMRHGIHDDEGHRAAKNFMQQAHRGRLLVQDTEGIRGENDGLMERKRDQATADQQARAMKNAQPVPAGKSDGTARGPATVIGEPHLAASKQYANGPEPYRRGPDETVTCPYCGKGDAPDARYCDQCGRELPASAFTDLGWSGVLGAIELATFAGKKPGSGHNFAKLSGSLAKRGVKDPDALAAFIGRKKYGKKGFAKLGHSHTAEPGSVIELRYNPDQPRDRHGRWEGIPGMMRNTASMRMAQRAGLIKALGASQAAERAARRTEGAHGKLSDRWEPTPSPNLGNNPFGRHLSKKEAAGFTDIFRAGLGKGKRKEQSGGTLGRLFQPGQVTESIAGGTGVGDNAWASQARKMESAEAKQAQTYAALRATGHSHSAAMNIIRGVSHRIGRALQAGSVTESISQYAWEDVLGAIELSAQTGRLVSEPHPFGKPGGPGLWGVKGMELPPYIQNIARALLRTGRAKTLSQAIAMAKGATNRWAAGKNTSPEVRAASTATNASWKAKEARAHAHTNDWDHLVELTGTAAGAAQDSRTPLGTFGSGGQAAQPKSRAQRKAALLAKAKADRAAARLLAIRISADRAALASASGKVTKGQKGATTTAKASTTKSSAPKTASPTSAAATGLSPARISSATTAAKAAAGKMSKAQLTAAIKTLSTQEKNLLAAAATAASQAARA